MSHFVCIALPFFSILRGRVVASLLPYLFANSTECPEVEAPCNKGWVEMGCGYLPETGLVKDVVPFPNFWVINLGGFII